MTEQTRAEGRDSTCGPEDLREHRHAIQQRETAVRRGIAEAELLGEQVGLNVVRLRTDWQLTLHRLGAVGPVVGLTGNGHATIESVTVYRNCATRGPAAQISDGDTDLCLFLSEWRTGFAVTEEGCLGPRRSLQFFDAADRAVHKIFLRQDSDVDAFDDLVDRQASENQGAIPVAEAVPRDLPTSTREIDTHDESLPAIDSLDLEQAHRFSGPLQSQRVARTSLRQVLEAAIVSQVPLLMMVGNHGAIQIHSGPVRSIQTIDGWLTILDAKFNLHIDEQGIVSAWVVRKATRDGVVASLELYDRSGEMVVYLARV